MADYEFSLPSGWQQTELVAVLNAAEMVRSGALELVPKRERVCCSPLLDRIHEWTQNRKASLSIEAWPSSQQAGKHRQLGEQYEVQLGKRLPTEELTKGDGTNALHAEREREVEST